MKLDKVRFRIVLGGLLALGACAGMFVPLRQTPTAATSHLHHFRIASVDWLLGHSRESALQR